MFIFNRKEGYVALISILIISALLLTTTLSLTQFGIAQRFFMLQNENKVISYNLATACAELVYIYIYITGSTLPPLPVNFPIHDFECSIISIQQFPDSLVFITRASFGQSFTTLEIILDARTKKVRSWKQL